MTSSLTAGAALILIDIQEGFKHPRWGQRNNPQAEERAAELLSAWRTLGWPIYHVQHLSLEADSPLRADAPGSSFQPLTAPLPGETIITKHVNSAFIGTDLEVRLRAAGTTQLVIAGLTTDHCVSTTTRMAGNLGFEVRLVRDAAATFERKAGGQPSGQCFTAQQMHDINLASLDGEFACVLDSAEVLAAVGKAAGASQATT
ncbi:cysteine hydrolase family protein [Deinococcus sp.]|uniref:cysteine hydrolase family protein n=1 Tax=Deinococcus sp. TaxID=47478 RepID=UPI003B5A5671